MHLNTFGLTYSFEFFTDTFNVGDHYGDVPLGVVVVVVVVVGVVVVPGVVGLIVVENMWCHWLRAHFGNWQTSSDVLMCCNSLSNVPWEEDTTLALCANVL